MTRRARVRGFALAPLALSLAGSGCASAGRIAEYDFRDRTLAVVAVVPPRPFVDTGDDVDLTGLDPVAAVLKVGTSIYKEREAGRLRARLDSASAGLELSDRVASGVLERSARYLGATAVDDGGGADFRVEVLVEEYGVSAREWEGGARFRLRARMLLLDRDGREVWEGEVDEDEEVVSGWFSPGSAATDVWTGRALGALTVAEVTRALEAIADHAAVRLTEKLRQGAEKARGR